MTSLRGGERRNAPRAARLLPAVRRPRGGNAPTPAQPAGTALPPEAGTASAAGSAGKAAAPRAGGGGSGGEGSFSHPPTPGAALGPRPPFPSVPMVARDLAAPPNLSPKQDGLCASSAVYSRFEDRAGFPRQPSVTLYFLISLTP